MSDIDPLIGRTLGGRYRIEACIGRGGFGSVYRAEHLELERPVAIKTLTSRPADGDGVLARFRREARLQAELRHPAIVRLLDFGREPDGLLYMVQEYVDGRTLQSEVDGGRPLPLARAIRLADAVLQGLAAAHRRGIVHRDLKPANVMLVDGPDGEEVRILDFGLAKVRDSAEGGQTITATGQILGTPAFMAPEQIEQRAVGPATDLYAVGGMLYLLLTGRRPFTGSLRAVLTAHLIKPPPTLPAALPAALDAVIAGAMAKLPEERFETAEEMAAALRAAAHTTGPAVADIVTLDETPDDPEAPGDDTLVSAPVDRPSLAAVTGLTPSMSSDLRGVIEPPEGEDELVTYSRSLRRRRMGTGLALFLAAGVIGLWALAPWIWRAPPPPDAAAQPDGYVAPTAAPVVTAVDEAPAAPVEVDAAVADPPPGDAAVADAAVPDAAAEVDAGVAAPPPIRRPPPRKPPAPTIDPAQLQFARAVRNRAFANAGRACECGVLAGLLASAKSDDPDGPPADWQSTFDALCSPNAICTSGAATAGAR